MNALRLTLVSALVWMFLGLHNPSDARAGTGVPATDHTLTGELVITDAIGDQFRIVRHRGTYTAPTGTSLRALDGKPVRVDIDSSGLALRVHEIPIHIEPITHSFDLISGELLVRDPAARTVAIAGDDVIYTAPAAVDITQHAGRLVEIRVDDSGRVTGIGPAAHAVNSALQSSRQCVLSDASIAHGLSICRHGTTFRCTDGEWVNTGAACS